MRWSFVVVMVLGLSVAVPGPSSAAVLCSKKSGVVVVRTDACKRKETLLDPIALGLQGPQGAEGPEGPQGPIGPPGPSGKFAVVAADGTILAQSGGITIETIFAAPGLYALSMGEDVTSKAIQVTTFSTTSDGDFRGATVYAICGTTPPAIDCTSSGFPNDNQTLLVFTLNAANAAAEQHGFNLAVF